tara:strand:+ start:27175 stop:28173 length:999 start_codon:yes stop_codon:yes gene_type:complete
MKEFSAAVIGCGRAGSLFDLEDKRKVISSHCGAYTQSPMTDLIAICDKDKKKLSVSSDFWGIKKTYQTYHDLLDSEKIDILSICTLPESHLEIIDFSVKKGVKAIYCEKPISKSLSEANQIIQTCKENNILLTVNHQRRWSSEFLDIKNKIQEKQFGEIQHINFYYSRGVYNSGSHLFDLLRMLFGEVKKVFSTSSIIDFEKEPTISAFLHFKNNYSANLIGLDGNNYRAFDLEIFFTEAKLTINSSLEVSVSKAKESTRTKEFFELSRPLRIKIKKDKESPMVRAVEEIANNLVKKGFNSCSGVDGYKSLEIIHSLIESLEKKREIILPLR